MNEVWARFSIREKNFEISTLGNIRQLQENHCKKPDDLKIINNKCCAFFGKIRIGIADRLLREFLSMKIVNDSIRYKDDNLYNVSIYNLLITSQNFNGRSGPDLINPRPIDKAIEYRLANLDSPTKAEKIINDVSKSINYKYEKQPVFFSKKSFYILDYYFPKYRVAVEVDGRHHLEDLKQLFYDQYRNEYLLKTYNIETIRIPNQIALNSSLRSELTTELKKKILEKRNKRSELLLSNFFKNKYNVYLALLDIINTFKTEVRELNLQETELSLKLEQQINGKGYLGSISQRERQLLKSIIFGVFKNEEVYWKVKELTQACNSIGKIDELYFSNDRTIIYFQHLQKILKNFINITTKNGRIARGSIFYFKL